MIGQRYSMILLRQKGDLPEKKERGEIRKDDKQGSGVLARYRMISRFTSFFLFCFPFSIQMKRCRDKQHLTPPVSV